LGFRNSLVMGLGVSALAVVLGVPIAWAVSRTDMPWKGLVRTLVLATFVTPPFLGATAWILLAGPKAGWVNVGFKALFQTDSGPFNIYSFPGIIFVIAIYSFPYVFVFTTAALELVSSEMDDAAAILGAGRLKTIFRITLPLVLPAILSASVLTFLEAISLISSTIMVAIPARVNLIPLQLWEFFSYPLRVEAAAAYSMPLLAIAVAMFWFQKAVLGRKGYVALTGKGGQRRPTALGALRWAMLGYCLFVLTLSVILPYGVLAQGPVARQPVVREFHLSLRGTGRGRPVDRQYLPLFLDHRLRRGAARHLGRLYHYPEAAALGQCAECPHPHAAGGAGHRAGDRLLCLLCAAAAVIERHRHDPDPGVRDAIPADRLCQRLLGDARR
jgi:ABC-type Fe3+ transport system permease subunit